MEQKGLRLDNTESTAREEPSPHSLITPPDRSEPANTFRHRSWQHRRQQVFNALNQAGTGRSRLASFAGCGCQAWVLQSTTEIGTYRLVPDFCHDRWCVPCQNSRAARVATNLTEHLNGRPVRFLTLTLAANDLSLKQRTDFLLTAFRRLRRKSLWKEKVTGGAGFLEITRGRKGDHWHPHLHVLMEGKYFPKRTLAALWLEITGDSYVIDLSFVKDQRLIAKYIAKYTAKPISSRLQRDPIALTEAIVAMRGRKLIHAFGAWAKWQLLKVPTLDGWTMYAHINELLYRETTGDPQAHDVILCILHLPGAATGDEFSVLAPHERAPPQSDLPSEQPDIFGPDQLLLLP